MSRQIDKVLATDESTGEILLVGKSDIIISGLTAGTIKLQYKLTPSTELPSPDWVDFPEASYTTDVFQTIFISEHGTLFRLTGVGNNAGAYVRLATFLNR